MARPLAQLPPETVPCMVSGTYTVTVDDKDNSKSVTVGDTLSLSFSQCDDGDGPVNGGMALTIATYSLTPNVEDVAGSITFQSLAIASEPFSYSLSGGAAFRFTFTLKTDGEELLSSFTVASGGMTVARQAVVAGGLSDSYSYRAGFTVSDRDFMSTVQGVPSSEDPHRERRLRTAVARWRPDPVDDHAVQVRVTRIRMATSSRPKGSCSRAGGTARSCA